MIEIKVSGRMIMVSDQNPYKTKWELANIACADEEYAEHTAQEVLEILAALGHDCRIVEG